jgi:hypothetical protein
MPLYHFLIANSVGPGHRPVVNGPEPAIMVEFSQDPTVTTVVNAANEKKD